MSEEDDRIQLMNEFYMFIDSFKSTQLATTDKNGVPHASYAPVLRKGNRFYVYVSGLARHTNNLESSSHASLLFVENESLASEIFARKRVSFDCNVSVVSKETTEWNRLIEGFAARFGAIMDVLRELPDFQFFELEAVSSNYVKGFGKAFTFSGKELESMGSD